MDHMRTRVVASSFLLRLLAACGIALLLTRIFALDLLDALLPVYQHEIAALSADGRPSSLILVRIAEPPTLRLRTELPQARGWMESQLNALGALQGLAVFLIVLTAWPAAGAAEWTLRSLIAVPLLMVLLLVDAPLELLGNLQRGMLAYGHSNRLPGLYVWDRFLDGGGALALAIGAAAVAVAAGRWAALRSRPGSVGIRRRALAGAAIMGLLVAGGLQPRPVCAFPLSAASQAQLAAGRTLRVLVEFDTRAADAAAAQERGRRRLSHDDAAITAQRARLYATEKAAVESAVTDTDARATRDFAYLPLAVWQISTPAALRRLQAQPSILRVHEDATVHLNSVSDLAFVDPPPATDLGDLGSGTTVAIIDGGLSSNYTLADFGSCTAVGTPAGSCRVVYNKDYYPPGAYTSALVAHGTNVAAIALGVAPGARMAMFDVFNGATGTALDSDIVDAMNLALQNQTAFNIVAVNMSLGDGSVNTSPCSGNALAAGVSALGNAGILSVAAAGNSGATDSLAGPACIPGVVSVGAVYDAAYGTTTYPGLCSDAGPTAPDQVTCFSQSASFLTMLAPGTFVVAPNASFEETGTSQATPHVTGAVAVLRARYPAEATSQTVARLRHSPVRDTVKATGARFPRLDLLDAVNAATAVSLAGSGPAQAVSGGTGTYTITVTNSGPLAATNVALRDVLPAAASFVSATSGCSEVAGVVSCSVGSLSAGAFATLTINVRWNTGGPVYDQASVSLDQVDNAAPPLQTLAFGTPPPSPAGASDAPLPLWSLLLLGGGLLLSARRAAPRL